MVSKCIGGKTARLPPPWEKYFVTSGGEILNNNGRKLTPYFSNGTVFVRTHIDGKVRMLNVAQAVYKAFVGELPFRRKITHKDGNKFNNVPENLYAIPYQRTDEQREQYEQWAIPCVKRYIAMRTLNNITGFDVDDFIGEALWLMWRNLYTYDCRVKFSTWSWKYLRMAFKHKFKKYSERVSFEINF